MTSRTANASIFITGVGGGIGTATARLFASKGWHVGGCDLSTAAVESLSAAIGRERFTPYVTDVRDRSAVARAIDDFAALCGGKLDAVFANAGVLFMAPDDQVTPAQKDLQVDVNVKGVMYTFDAALPHLRRAAPGTHMVAMASTSAEYGSPHHAVYSATKFFVRGYTEALNIEYRPQGINVCGIYVAYVDTGMVRNAEWKAASLETMGVKAKPEDVAAMVWKAVHGRRAHWRVGFDAWMSHCAVRLLGSWVAPIYAKLMRI
ncbi:MAG: SDR family NAD(P)-dependent oxidoreductase [Proteobacteria bacterium]|nr:SDR family NAD(P)-dependent oxidoreductase [Pseudomonadota bacterium]